MKHMTLRIPTGLAASCRKTPERTAWLDGLGDLVRILEARWSLTFGAPFESDGDTSCSYVTPVVFEGGTPAVLKIGMPHMEAEHEIAGLRFWQGGPTVRLLKADDELGAMLLERCRPGTSLRTLSESEQDVEIARLLRRLWRLPPAVHPFRPLSALMLHWSRQTLVHVEQWPDQGLVREGLSLFSKLPDSESKQLVLATDLHAGNVLRAEREPWLVIDPKPFVGDPAYDATQHLFNCQTRLRADPHGTIRSFADLLGVDHERVRLWTFARAAAEPRDDWHNDDWLALARSLAPYVTLAGRS
jgi:streptomycin 6-kinase